MEIVNPIKDTMFGLVKNLRLNHHLLCGVERQGKEDREQTQKIQIDRQNVELKKNIGLQLLSIYQPCPEYQRTLFFEFNFWCLIIEQQNVVAKTTTSQKEEKVMYQTLLAKQVLEENIQNT